MVRIYLISVVLLLRSTCGTNTLYKHLTRKVKLTEIKTTNYESNRPPERYPSYSPASDERLTSRLRKRSTEPPCPRKRSITLAPAQRTIRPIPPKRRRVLETPTFLPSPQDDVLNQSAPHYLIPKEPVVFPALIYDLPEHELIPIKERMKELGHYDPNNYPITDFTKCYKKLGNSLHVKRYCKHALDGFENALTYSKSRGRGPKARHSDDSSKGSSDDHDNVSRHKLRTSILSENQTVWHQEGLTGLGNDHSLAQIFQGLPREDLKSALKEIRSYDPSHPHLVRNDYCSWRASIAKDLTRYPPEVANYILLYKAGAEFSEAIVEEYGSAVREMSTLHLSRALGSLVYRTQDRNPIEVACQLRVGYYGMTNQADIYKRLIELHYCRPDHIVPKVFVAGVYFGIAFHLPTEEREPFFNRVCQRYPSVGTAFYSQLKTKCRSVSPRKDAGLPLPRVCPRLNEVH